MAYEDYDYSGIEAQLKERAKQKGIAYHESDLADIKSNTQNLGSNLTPEQAMEQIGFRKYDERAVNNPGGGDSGGSNTAMQQWNAQPAQPMQQAAAPAEDPVLKGRRDELYNTLLARSKQSLDTSQSPEIAAQMTAFRANQDRSTRNYLSDTAEQAGPLANLQGERRMAHERAGQAAGTMEAELRSRELMARRDEIQSALQGLAGILSQDQQLAWSRELAAINQMLEQQRINLSGQSLEQQWREALMRNDQFRSDLGLRAEQQNSYWDAVRRGAIGG